MTNTLKIIIIILLLQFVVLNSQSKIIDYLNISSPIRIENKSYNLAWSSHPSSDYYKQEYLSSNEKLEHYNKLIIIEFVEGDFSLDKVVDQKVNEIENLKKNNPLVNYNVYENNGEYILDFLVSENSKDGKEIEIVERNVYRYKLISNSEKNGVMLFAVSERAYENNINSFFENLKNNNTDLIEVVGNYQLPNIKVK
ncbi:hypothetical protein GCM10023210_32580 [Chryseobacterium ginsengisoli]|uniref:PsbP C-terminal domain-containing protein n=1 Tax=Chryseobacterium ginsengisoli TaxID=363853 RepID=A0ABP9MJL0_9FLAO